MPFYATIPAEIVGEIKELKGQQATYIPPDHPTAPLKGGWLVREATINPPLDDEALASEPRAHHAGRRPLRISRRRTLPRAKPDGQAAPTDGKPAARRVHAPPPQSEDRFRPHSEIAYLASLPPFPLVRQSRHSAGSTTSSIERST